MSKPPVLKFTDYDVPTSAISWQGPQSLAPTTWTRVKFNVPGDFTTREATRQVCEWLAHNCVGSWREHHFVDPRGKNGEYTVIVKFENRDDALMFKLRGGHQAWQQDS